MIRPTGDPQNKSCGETRKRPRWRPLILNVWSDDPLQCPHCQGRLRLLEIIEEETAIQTKRDCFISSLTLATFTENWVSEAASSACSMKETAPHP